MTPTEKKHFNEVRNSIGLMKNEDTRNHYGNHATAIKVLEAHLAALTAANAVSEPAQVDLPLTNEGDMPQAQGDAIIKHIEDAIKDHCSGSDLYMSALVAAGKIQALAAANAVSDHFRGVTEMVQPLGWYCVSRDGLATQCADQRDAEVTAESANRDWPNSAPYRAVQLCEFEAHPQATEPAGKTRDPLDLGQYVNEANISANDKPVAVIEKLQAVINVKKGFQ